MSLTKVGGAGFDGSNVTMSFGKLGIRCVKATYAETIETETLSEMGAQQIDARSRGTYKNENAKITMTAVRFRTEFLPAMTDSDMTGVGFPIVITRTHPDLGSDSDLLENARLTGIPASVENSASIEVMELEFVYSQVRWGDKRQTINRLANVEPVGTVGF